MAEQPQLVRQWILLRTLSARHGGATVKELVDELGVSEKTVRRDLETFQAAGLPLIETVEQFGRKKWRIDPAKYQPGMCFSYDEAVSLYLGRRLLEPLAGTLFWEAAHRAFKKIRASLGKPALKYVDQFAAIFHQTMVGASDYSEKAALIDDLMVAIEDRRAVFITYQSLRATEPVTYDIYPYGLAYHRGSLYLVGHKVDDPSSPLSPGEGAGVRASSDSSSPRFSGEGTGVRATSESGTVLLGSDDQTNRGLSQFSRARARTAGDSSSPRLSGEGTGVRAPLPAVRHWKVDRIQEVHLEELRFNRPDDFDLAAHFAKSFGVYQGDGEVHVKVRFSPAVARYVEESKWHASQQFVKEKDGSLTAEFDLDGTEEIKRWIMSFGQHAVVLEPDALRREIAADLQATLASYGQEAPLWHR